MGQVSFTVAHVSKPGAPAGAPPPPPPAASVVEVDEQAMLEQTDKLFAQFAAQQAEQGQQGQRVAAPAAPPRDVARILIGEQWLPLIPGMPLPLEEKKASGRVHGKYRVRQLHRISLPRGTSHLSFDGSIVVESLWRVVSLAFVRHPEGEHVEIDHVLTMGGAEVCRGKLDPGPVAAVEPLDVVAVPAYFEGELSLTLSAPSVLDVCFITETHP